MRNINDIIAECQSYVEVFAVWLQKFIELTAKPRGFHLVDQELLQNLPELGDIAIGIAHFFIQHSSASLTINENADPSVRADLERYLNVAVPENAAYFEHIYEGSDDMPAHIKASLLGASITVPIQNGVLQLGMWQGIYLGEHRNSAGGRCVVVTLNGE